VRLTAPRLSHTVTYRLRGCRLHGVSQFESHQVLLCPPQVSSVTGRVGPAGSEDLGTDPCGVVCAGMAGPLVSTADELDAGLIGEDG
jgi:hypothetical protein